MKEILCERCGSSELKLQADGEHYECEHCHAIWEKERVDEAGELRKALDEEKQERLANAIRNLYDAAHEKYSK